MLNMYRIGITCYPTHGGSGVVATELGKLLAERGHEVHFITYNMPFRLGQYHPNIFYHEVEVNHYALFQYPPYDLSLASKMAQVAKAKNLDLLHVHYAVPHAICAYLAKQMVGEKLKVVTTLHGTDITVLGYDRSLHDIIRFGIESSDAVTAVSDSLIRETRELFHIEQPITRIYNFVDHRVYYPRNAADIRSECARPEEKVLLHISNFRPVKRVQDVVYAFKRIQEEIPAKLLLIGEGPEWSAINELVSQLHLTDKVLFLGKQDEVAQMISSADLLLLPSEKESFGLVALEAMACGVPTIGTSSGGLPEVVKHGETGYLCEVGDTEGMARCALNLLQNPDLYRKFQREGIQRARTHFCAPDSVKAYEAVYEHVVEQKSENNVPLSK